VAGPAAGILLRHALTEEQLSDLEQWLYTITAPPKKRRRMRTRTREKRRRMPIRTRAPQFGVGPFWGPFWILDGTWIGLPDVDCSQPCGFDLYLEDERARYDLPEEAPEELQKEIHEAMLEEQLQFSDSLGYVPEQSIWLPAGCNRLVDHRLLGQMVLLLAERYHGMIHFNGALRPPLKPGQHWQEVTREERERYVEELSLPGQIYHIASNELTGAGRVTIWHLVDPEWFRAWLHHLQFHLIK
jgi:hypothetical protein